MDQAELIAKTVAPPTPKHAYFAIRSYPTEQERQAAIKQNSFQWPHLRPKSVLIAAMGFHWAPTSWNKVIDMMAESQKQGVYVGLQELQDRCLDPYDALGTMRNEAILLAEAEGFEFLLYVDNDVLPKPDTLLRLLSWDMPVVMPLVLEPGTGKQLSGPAVQPNSGLHPAKWAVLSMMLFRTAVFRPFRGRFWSDAVGADEGFHFLRLWTETGHRPYLDSNTQLVVAGEPLYPLAVNRFSKEERQKFWEVKIEKFNKPPDRRAVDPFGPGVMDGDYLPFAQMIPGAPTPTAGVIPSPSSIPAAWGQKGVSEPPIPTHVGWGAKDGKDSPIIEERKEEVTQHDWGSKRNVSLLQSPR